MTRGGLAERAPAKVNLSLRVLRRSRHGWHELESLVAFAGAHDRLTLVPGPGLDLVVAGERAEAAGPVADNLVVRAARALAERLPGLRTGAFTLSKQLPVAAGLGGGSANAAAALRLLARLNGLPLDHPAIREAAAATGADVPVCLVPTGRTMRGRGEEVGNALSLPPLPAVLVNPGVPVATAAVFAGLALAPGADGPSAGQINRPDSHASAAVLLDWLAGEPNDLEPPALALAPQIGLALAALRRQAGCRLARMSGSGATVFGLFDGRHAAARAAHALRAAEPGWWVRATMLR